MCATILRLFGPAADRDPEGGTLVTARLTEAKAGMHFRSGHSRPQLSSCGARVRLRAACLLIEALNV
jgi:hypothetical protein